MNHRVERVALKAPAPGTERFLTVHRFGTPGARPKAYLQAALHADEWPGLIALNHLIARLKAADAEGRVKGEIVILPYANPIGLDQRIGAAPTGRYALDGTGNFNRNWPDLSSAAAALLGSGFSGEPDRDIPAMRDALRAAVADLPRGTENAFWRAQVLSLSIDADYVIDVHCDQESLPHIYCHIDHAPFARRLAAAIDIPIVLLEEEAGGFSFDDCNAGVWRRMGAVTGGESLPMACFGCTLELRGKDDVNDVLGAADAEGLMRFLCAEGLVEGEEPLDSEGPDPYRLDQVDVIYCDTGGLLAYKAEIGDLVTEGQVIAEVIDLAAADPSLPRTQLCAETDGVFFARADLRLVQPGDSVAKVAGRRSLASRKKGALLEA